MITIENTEIFGWEAAIRGMRNPFNSWNLSDSRDLRLTDECNNVYFSEKFFIGDNDLKLMKQLSQAGSDHRKYLRMITAYVDVTAPFYWWKEYDTYKVGTVANSCSTMHRIHSKEFELSDFSVEQLLPASLEVFKNLINTLNIYRDMFLESKDKEYWWQLIQLLPTSYNQKRTLMLNYEVLKNIYHARKNHKLDEWHSFCEWIERLPYSELITD